MDGERQPTSGTASLCVCVRLCVCERGLKSINESVGEKERKWDKYELTI